MYLKFIYIPKKKEQTRNKADVSSKPSIFVDGFLLHLLCVNFNKNEHKNREKKIRNTDPKHFLNRDKKGI